MTSVEALRQLESAIISAKPHLSEETYRKLVRAYREVKRDYERNEDDLK